MLPPQSVRTFFVTSVTAGRRRLFQVEGKAELLMQVFADNRAKNRLALHAFVVMPDHFHLLITPAENVSLEKAMQFIKGGFSFRLKSAIEVWERSFNEHRIRDTGEYQRCRAYIEQNPVRKRLVQTASDFSFSSASPRREVDACPTWFRSGAGAEAPNTGRG